MGFSGNGYNAMNKDGSAPYTWSSMQFQDSGDTGMGWIPANGGGKGFQYLTGPAVPTSMQDPISVLQNPCNLSSLNPAVTVLAYTNSSAAPNPANIVGYTSSGVFTTVISLASVGNGFYIGQGQVVSPIAKTIANNVVSIQWSQAFNDGITGTVLATTPIQVFATYAVPNGNQFPVTAKQVDWATKIGNTAGTITCAAQRFSKALDSSPGFDLTNDNPSQPWVVLDSGKRADCITLSAIARVGLYAVGIPVGIGRAYPVTQNQYPIYVGGQFVNGLGNGSGTIFVPIESVDPNPPIGIVYAGLIYLDKDGGRNVFESYFTVQDDQNFNNALQVWTVDPPMGPFVNGNNVNLNVLSQLNAQEGITLVWVGLTQAQLQPFQQNQQLVLSQLPIVGNTEPLLNSTTPNNGVPTDANGQPTAITCSYNCGN